MSNMDAVLVQYQVFAERRLHYGRMFWANIAFLIAVLVAIFGVVQGLSSAGIPFFLMAAGFATLQMAFIAHRLKRLEDRYEALMYDTEVALKAAGQNIIVTAPQSGRMSARTMTVLSLVAMGLILLGLGLLALSR